MSLQTVKTDWFNGRFLSAMSLALLAHGVLLSGITLLLSGTSVQYRVDMVFWGSILRSQDLQPQVLEPVKDVSGQLIFEPSKLLEVIQSKGWLLGVTVDKPAAPGSFVPKNVPLKFLTKRVDPDNIEPDAVTGIPDAPRIPLRMTP